MGVSVGCVSGRAGYERSAEMLVGVATYDRWVWKALNEARPSPYCAQAAKAWSPKPDVLMYRQDYRYRLQYVDCTS